LLAPVVPVARLTRPAQLVLVNTMGICRAIPCAQYDAPRPSVPLASTRTKKCLMVLQPPQWSVADNRMLEGGTQTPSPPGQLTLPRSDCAHGLLFSGCSVSSTSHTHALARPGAPSFGCVSDCNTSCSLPPLCPCSTQLTVAASGLFLVPASERRGSLLGRERGTGSVSAAGTRPSLPP
jgi:hypothetical protein